jgi:hypothetical protein
VLTGRGFISSCLPPVTLLTLSGSSSHARGMSYASVAFRFGLFAFIPAGSGGYTIP